MQDTPTKPAPPKKGDVVKGHVFLGGDPAVKENWKPDVPQQGDVRKGYQYLGGDPGKKESWAPVSQRPADMPIDPNVVGKPQAQVSLSASQGVAPGQSTPASSGSPTPLDQGQLQQPPATVQDALNNPKVRALKEGFKGYDAQYPTSEQAPQPAGIEEPTVTNQKPPVFAAGEGGWYKQPDGTLKDARDVRIEQDFQERSPVYATLNRPGSAQYSPEREKAMKEAGTWTAGDELRKTQAPLMMQADILRERQQQLDNDAEKYGIAQAEARMANLRDEITRMEQLSKSGQPIDVARFNDMVGVYNQQLERIRPFYTEQQDILAAKDYVKQKFMESEKAFMNSPEVKEGKARQEIMDRRFAAAEKDLDRNWISNGVIDQYVLSPMASTVTGAVLNAAAALGRTLDAVGNTINYAQGKEGYYSPLAEAADNLNAAARELTPTPSQVQEPLFDKNWDVNTRTLLPKALQAATYMGLLTGGGVSGGDVGLVGASYMTTEEDYYSEAIAAGMKPGQAQAFSMGAATLTSLLEGVSPGPFVTGKTVKGEMMARAINAIRDGKQWDAALVDATKYVLKEGAFEGMQEGLQAVGDDVSRAISNLLVGDDKLQYQSPQVYADNVMLGIAMGALSATAGRIADRPLHMQALDWAVRNRKKVEDFIKKNKFENSEELLSNLETISNIYEGNDLFAMKPEKSAKVASLIQQKDKVEQEVKEKPRDEVVASVSEDPRLKKAKELTDQIIKLVTPSDEEETDAAPSAEAAGQDVRLSKAKIEAEAKRLGYLSARSFNTQNTLNENPSPEVAALLHAISEHHKLVIGKKEIRDLVSMDGEDFGLWAKTHEPARDGTGNLVREEEIPLAVLRIQALRDRGMNKLADTEEQQLRLSKKKENWTIDEWKSRHDEEISQGEVDEKNKEAESFNAELKKAQDKLVDAAIEAAVGNPQKQRVNEITQKILGLLEVKPEESEAAMVDTGAAPAPENTKAVTAPDGSVTLEKKPETGGAKAATATASAQPAKKENTSKAVESVFSADEATGEEETPAAPTGVPEGGVPVSTEAATASQRIVTKARLSGKNTYAHDIHLSFDATGDVPTSEGLREALKSVGEDPDAVMVHPVDFHTATSGEVNATISARTHEDAERIFKKMFGGTDPVNNQSSVERQMPLSEALSKVSKYAQGKELGNITNENRTAPEATAAAPATDTDPASSVPMGERATTEPVATDLTEDLPDDPKVLADAYYDDHQIWNSNANPEYAMINAMKGRVKESSYDEWGDPNDKGQQMAKTYFAKKDARTMANQGQTLDQIAQELTEELGREVSPDELAELMRANQSGLPRTSPRMRQTADRYKAITGKRLTSANGARNLKQKGKAAVKDSDTKDFIDQHTDQDGNVNWQGVKDNIHALGFLGYTDEQARELEAEADRQLAANAGGGKILAAVPEAEADAGRGADKERAVLEETLVGARKELEAYERYFKKQAESLFDKDAVESKKRGKVKRAEPSMFEAEGDTRANTAEDMEAGAKTLRDRVALAEKALADYDAQAGAREKAVAAQATIPEAPVIATYRPEKPGGIVPAADPVDDKAAAEARAHQATHDSLLQKGGYEKNKARIKEAMRLGEQAAKKAFVVDVRIDSRRDVLGGEKAGNTASISFSSGGKYFSNDLVYDLFFDVVNGKYQPNDLAKSLGVRGTDNSYSLPADPAKANEIAQVLADAGFNVRIVDNTVPQAAAQQTSIPTGSAEAAPAYLRTQIESDKRLQKELAELGARKFEKEEAYDKARTELAQINIEIAKEAVRAEAERRRKAKEKKGEAPDEEQDEDAEEADEDPIDPNVKPSSAAQKLADRIRETGDKIADSMEDPNTLSATFIPPKLIRAAFRFVAKAIETGGDIHAAIAKAVNYIMDSAWYKKLTAEDREVADTEMADEFARLVSMKRFAELKNKWIGDTDFAAHDANVDAANIQDRIKATVPKQGVVDPGWAKRWQKVDQAILVYLDLKGNPEHLAQFADKLTPEQQDILNLSQNLTDAQKAIADEIRTKYDALAARAMDAGQITNALDDYVARFWDFKGQPAADIGRFKTSTRHKLRRSLGSILEGWAQGYDLRIKTASNALQAVSTAIDQAIANKEYLKQGARIAYGPQGTPLFSTYKAEGYAPVDNEGFSKWDYAGELENFIPSPDTDLAQLMVKLKEYKQRLIDKHGEGWKEKMTDEDKDVLRILVDEVTAARQVATQLLGRDILVTPEGTVIKRSRLYAPKNVAKDLNAMLNPSALADIPAAQIYSRWSNAAKQSLFLTSLFHHQAFMRSHLLGGPMNKLGNMNLFQAYREGLQMIREKSPEVEQLVRAGLTVGRMQDFNELSEVGESWMKKHLDKMGVSQDGRTAISNLHKSQTRWLFEKFGAGMKTLDAVNDFRREVQRNRKLPAEKQETLDQIAQRVARLANQNYGGLNLKRTKSVFTGRTRSATEQQLWRWALLAPDWCVDAKTRALTKDGWKAYDQLSVGDEIMAFDPETRKYKWSALKDKYENHAYDGEMVKVANHSRAVMMTPDHKCYVYNFSKERHEVVLAKDLKSSHLIPRCGEPFDLPEVPVYSDHFVRIVGWMVTDGNFKVDKWKRKDGTYGTRTRAFITQAKPKTVAILKGMGISFYTTKTKDHDKFRSNYLCHKFEVDRGITASLLEARINTGLSWGFLGKLTRQQLQLLYDTMMLGDGTGQRRFCGKEREVSFMSMVQIMLGHSVTFHQQEKNCWITRSVTSKHIYVEKQGRKPLRVHYKGTIWCPSVDTGFWVAEREGLVFLTGNTESNLQMAADAFKAGKLGDYARRSWARVIVRGAATWAAFNLLMALFPDPDDPEDEALTPLQRMNKRFDKAWNEGHLRWTMWDVTPIFHALGGDPKKRIHYSIFGHFTDPLKIISTDHNGRIDGPIRFASSKLNPAGSRPALDLLKGSDWKNERFTTLDELVGLDDKGKYKRDIRGHEEGDINPDTGLPYKRDQQSHMAGDEKGGKLAWRLTGTKFGEEGPVSAEELPSWALNSVRGVLPTQAQNAEEWATGERDGVYALMQSLGLGVHMSTDRQVEEEKPAE